MVLRLCQLSHEPLLFQLGLFQYIGTNLFLRIIFWGT